MAREEKIVVLNFDPGGRGAADLCDLLATASRADLRFSLEARDVPRCDDAVDRELSDFLRTAGPKLVFLVAPGEELRRVLDSIAAAVPATPVFLAMRNVGGDAILSALNLGVADCFTPPFRSADVQAKVWRLFGVVDSEQERTRALREHVALKQLVGVSPAFCAEVRKIPSLARYDTSVLISGETGTGKEMFARAIHYLSTRARQPFVPVNCGALPLDLVENELFGHERGAFTGALASQAGLVKEAHGGTLFLDEVDSISLNVQVKLLRFLQNKEYRPLGAGKTSRADVRVMAATNTDVEQAVAEGKLRADLYYRLNVVPLVIPPLRERPQDIPLLADHFLRKYAAELGRGRMRFTEGAARKLLSHDWPGNVRELEHVVERAVVLSESQTIGESGVLITLAQKHDGESFQAAKSKVVAEFEKSYVQGLLAAYRGNISRSARAAKKNRRAFFELVRRHQIDVEQFRP